LTIDDKNKKKTKKLYKQWKRYLSDSRLDENTITKRAKTFTRKGMKPDE